MGSHIRACNTLSAKSWEGIISVASIQIDGSIGILQIILHIGSYHKDTHDTLGLVPHPQLTAAFSFPIGPSSSGGRVAFAPAKTMNAFVEGSIKLANVVILVHVAL